MKTDSQTPVEWIRRFCSIKGQRLSICYFFLLSFVISSDLEEIFHTEDMKIYNSLQTFQYSIFSSQQVHKLKGLSTPGHDDLNTMAWRELWPVVGKHMHIVLSVRHRGQGFQTNQFHYEFQIRKTEDACLKLYTLISLLSAIVKSIECYITKQIAVTAIERRVISQLYLSARGMINHVRSPSNMAQGLSPLPARITQKISLPCGA